MQILQGLDCDAVQGDFFSRPIPPEAVPDIARKGYLEREAPGDGATERKVG